MFKEIIRFYYFFLFINFQILEGDIEACKQNSDLGNLKCFNNIIKFEGGKYRAGRFVTTKNGELIIEYSEDSTPGGGRLFYRLTKEGRGYYEDDNPIRKFKIDKVVSIKDEHGENFNCSGRYEARNALMILDGDETEKEYLFSTSSWFSFTELHDLDSGNYSFWFTTDFFNLNDKYIFSYNYEILRQPNTHNYFIIYTQYDSIKNDKSFSESYYIRKFKLDSFNQTYPYNEIKVTYNTNNENDRIVSAFIMENKELLVVLFLSGNDLILKTYSYDLESSSSDETTIGGSWDYPPGNGIFFKALSLDNDYVAIISNPNYISSNDKQMTLSLYKYENSFESKFEKKMILSL